MTAIQLHHTHIVGASIRLANSATPRRMERETSEKARDIERYVQCVEHEQHAQIDQNSEQTLNIIQHTNLYLHFIKHRF